MASRPPPQERVGLFLALALMYASFFGARAWWEARLRVVVLEAVKSDYLHYEIVDLRVRTPDPSLRRRWIAAPPRAVVLRDGRRVKTVAGIESVPLRFDGIEWVGRWPCPWNAPAGQYRLELEGAGDLAGHPVRARPFRISYRAPQSLPKGFAVLTLESAAPLASLKVRGPDGKSADWRGLLDWAQYVGADAFWMLAGQTPGREGRTWIDDNFSVFPEVARECQRRGLKFGLYAMCYLTMSKERLPRYRYALEVSEGASVPTRAISLADPNRPEDVAELLARLRDIPGVDFLGLDYIRNALGGYELVDEFFAEMPGVHPPPGWDRLSREERMVYLARKKVMRRDEAFIDAWQWWRAHRVGRIVRRIKDRLGDSKPLWAFVLTWDKGWHHGQDPVMMSDAGVDANALMLYEADEEQFSGLIKDWRGYVKSSDAQLVVGDVVDWPLHQRSPEGPAALRRRLVSAVDGIHADAPARGLFVHDVGRALWGRLGPWSTREWMDQARAAIAHIKSRSREAAPR